MTQPDDRLAPVRRNRGAARTAPVTGPDPDEADLARGQAAAVLGALGRLQLRVELLAREQADVLGAVLEQLRVLDARVTELTADHDRHVPPRHAAAPAPPAGEPPTPD